jgi:two-component system OmpR family response regulator
MSQHQPVKRPAILIVEDDFEIARMLAVTLTEAGMSAEIAGDGIDMDACLRRATFDLIVLDVMLPGEDGFSLCRRLRANSTVPIMMLTAQGEEVDRIVGIEIGADDYVTKPFSAREVTARIRGLLRRRLLQPVGGGRGRLAHREGRRREPVHRRARPVPALHARPLLG